MTTAPTRNSKTASQPLSARLELLNDFLDIIPDKFLISWIAQQISGMQSRHEFDSMILMPPPAQPHDRNFSLQQRLHGEFSQSDNDLGFDEINLALQKRFTRLDLIGLGIAVLRRTALDHVGDVDILPPETHSLGN